MSERLNHYNSLWIIIFTFVCFIISSHKLLSQSIIAFNKYIEDPTIFSENEESPAALLVPFANIEQAKKYYIQNSEYYFSLNGNWKFDYRINPSEVTENFYSTEFKEHNWKEIKVPSVWQMQGYDHLMYRNVPMEFTPYDPPKVPDDINPTGCYRKEFNIPESFTGRRTFIHFYGVQSAMFLWINGQYVGYHEDGMTSAEYDITKFIKPGKNIAAAMVIRWCDGSYLEDQDMFRFSGIYRDVFIYSKPEVMLKDIFIRTDLDEEYENAEINIDCKFKNFTSAKENFNVRFILYNKDGSQAVYHKSEPFNIGQQTQKSFSFRVDAPLKWSDEKPNLYILTVELLDNKGNLLEVMSKRIGIRELEVKDGLALLNGKPVYFRGTNRHEHNPDNGRTLTKELMLKDIELLKMFNFNSVRTSHYPNDPLWYDLCDEYGILLQDEVNAECHYTEDIFPTRKDYFNAFMDRFKRMVERDKNHPSVVMWSTGNECGLAEPHYAMADFIKQYDPTRFLMHQSNVPDGEAPYVDIIGPRYPTPSEIHQIGQGSSKPVVMGEYAHAMGNSLGHFDEFWEIIYNTPKLHGGFVWDWVDQGLNVNSRFVVDSSPNKIQCGVMGNPEIVKGLNGNALKLSGLDDWIEVYDDPRLDIRGKNLIIEAVVYPQKFYTENPIVTKANQYGIIQMHPDSLLFYINSYRNNLKIKVPADWSSAWHKIRAVYDGSKMRLFIDDNVLGEKEYSENIRSTHHPLNVGRDALRNNDQLPGWISNYIYDDVKIYADDNTQPILSLSFDELKDGENYLTYGISPFCHNGMITADRKPQPELWQAKHSMSPIRFYSDDPRSGKFKVVNKYAFTELIEFDFTWYLYVNGKNAKSGKLNLNTKPLSEDEFNIPVIKVEQKDEYILEFSCRLKNKDQLRDQGFEVYFQQFTIKPDAVSRIPFTMNSNTAIEIKEENNSYSFVSGRNTFELNKATGDISFYISGKQIMSFLNSNVWRAPISNERVSWGSAEAEVWYRMGLHEYTNRAENISINFNKDSNTARVKVLSYTMFPDNYDYIQNNIEYVFTGNGTAVIKHEMIPAGQFHVEWLPCIGLSFKTPEEYQSVKWYGHGPYENYADRNSGSRIGIHSVKIDSVMIPYAEPQDYGNYSGVRWFEITNTAGDGIRIEAANLINFSAVPYKNLDRARYTYQLQKDGHSRIGIHYAATGVGDTPNPVMPPYRAYPLKYYNEIIVTPINNIEQSAK